MAVAAMVMSCAALFATGSDAAGDSAGDGETPVVGTYNIIYVVNSTAFTDNVEIKEGIVTLPAELPEGATAPIGQKFEGWMYNSDIVKSIGTSEAPAVKDKTYTVTAVFSVVIYDVTFIANGVSATTEYNYNEAVVIPESVDPAKVAAPEGYSFAGWSNGTATITAIPAVTGNVTYVAVFEKTVAPVETFTVTFMVGEEVYATQTVENIKDAILPFIDGYSWGEAVIDAEGNAVISAIADPVQPENSFGITNTELAIIIGAFLAVILALFIIAYKLGFIEIGKKGVVKE